ncbi:MAG: ABC transporter ATP-binding protein [Candidatus Heimdallarchaeaceae archaeon]
MNNDSSKNDEDIVISLRNVTKTFGSFIAVNNVSLDIKKGEIIGFLGPNGAGKSTTMKMIARLLIPDHGEIWIKGNGFLQKLTHKSKDYLLDNVGFLIENPAFYKHMTPRQVLSYFAELKGYPKKLINSRVEEVVEIIGMSDWIDKKLGTFSKGMRQKIGIVSAIVHDPEVVILDEPQTGLDPKARKEVRAFIKGLKAKGKTVFISSHLLYEISELADRIGIIYNGQLIAFDTLETLEKMSKRSVLQIEILQPYDTEKTLAVLNNIIGKINGLSNLGKEAVTYNTDLKLFEVTFDGSPEKQQVIFDALAHSGLKVLGVSVPRTNLLEDLYLKYISQTDLGFEHENGEIEKTRVTVSVTN